MPGVLKRSSLSRGSFRVSLSLTCLLVIAFSIALIGLVIQLLAFHHITDIADHKLIVTSSINIDSPNNDSNGDRSTSSSVVDNAQIISSTPNNNNKRSSTVAYVVTITGCSEKHHTAHEATSLITQGAATLRHSIDLAHSSSSHYNYQMYAIIHPTATTCSVAPLQQLGYNILIRNTPFDKADIRQQFLRQNIDGASCCGAKEYLKLYAYTLVEYPIVVVLDLDSLVLRSMDGLFDALLMSEQHYDGERGDMNELLRQLPIHSGSNNQVDTVASLFNNGKVTAFYTKDYNMINPGGEQYAGVQGGFLMIRPDESVFAEYIELVLQGNYIEGRGWGGKYGYFFGGAQIQGICSYYFGELHPERGVELNRCRVNLMVDNPRFDEGNNGKAADSVGKCRDGREECEDCRAVDLEDVYSAHFTICGKPWKCYTNLQPLCSKLHSEWFRIRRSYEESRSDDEMRQLPALEGSYRPEIYHGYCKGAGGGNYLPLKI